MPWLNWSLKLHIRLKTISSLVPTHITHVYAQWMPYSFVWLYLIKCVFTYSIFVDQTKKDFWVFYFVFGKSFVFGKNIKNFKKKKKTLCCPVLATWSWVKLVASLLRRFSWLTGRSKSQLWKIFRKFFKIWFLNFFATYTGDLFVGGSSSREGYTEIFAAPFATSLRVELLVAKNT